MLGKAEHKSRALKISEAEDPARGGQANKDDAVGGLPVKASAQVGGRRAEVARSPQTVELTL